MVVEECEMVVKEYEMVVTEDLDPAFPPPSADGCFEPSEFQVVYMCMCVCVHIYIYIHTYIHTYIHISSEFQVRKT
jgi:hypothetical protein